MPRIFALWWKIYTMHFRYLMGVVSVIWKFPARRFDIKNNAWVTVNNDFLITSEVICQSLANHITSDRKSLFSVTNVLFYFLHVILCPEYTIPLKTIIDHWFRHCRQGRSFLTYYCDVTTVVTRTRDSSIVTSYSSIVLARVTWRKGYLH